MCIYIYIYIHTHTYTITSVHYTWMSVQMFSVLFQEAKVNATSTWLCAGVASMPSFVLCGHLILDNRVV